MAKKTQKEIACGHNSDKDTITKTKEAKDPGAAVNEAIKATEAKADMERVTFRTFHCPLDEKSNCSKKTNLKSDKDDIETTATVYWDKTAKVWRAEAKSTWEASFDCEKP